MSTRWIGVLLALCLCPVASCTVRTGEQDEKARRRWKKQVRKGWELTDVVVAKHNIAPGTILSEDLLTTDKIPRKFRTAAHVIPKELDTVVGNEVVFPVHKGDPLSWHHLRGRETAKDNPVTKRGRGMPVRVATPVNAGRGIRKADHVDVIGVFPDPATKQLVSRTILQNIIVLGVGRGTRPDRAKGKGGKVAPRRKGRRGAARVLTLLVLSKEAEALALIQKVGELHVTLRNAEDLGVQQTPGKTSLDVVLSGEWSKKLREERYQTIQRIKIVRGLPGLNK